MLCIHLCYKTQNSGTQQIQLHMKNKVNIFHTWSNSCVGVEENNHDRRREILHNVEVGNENNEEAGNVYEIDPCKVKASSNLVIFISKKNDKRKTSECNKW